MRNLSKTIIFWILRISNALLAIIRHFGTENRAWNLDTVKRILVNFVKFFCLIFYPEHFLNTLNPYLFDVLRWHLNIKNLHFLGGKKEIMSIKILCNKPIRYFLPNEKKNFSLNIWIDQGSKLTTVLFKNTTKHFFDVSIFMINTDLFPVRKSFPVYCSRLNPGARGEHLAIQLSWIAPWLLVKRVCGKMGLQSWTVVMAINKLSNWLLNQSW